MPKTVIVPLDGSEYGERALVVASAFAQRSGAPIVTVIARPGGVPDAERYLAAAASRAGIDSARGVVFEDRLAASAITTLAGSEPDPVICMTTHARSGAGQVVFGSVAEDVMRRAEVPLVLVGPSVGDAGRWRFEELVVCLDGSPAASEILPIAAAFARDLGLAVWLVEVVDPDLRNVAGTAADGNGNIVGSAYLPSTGAELASAGLTVNWKTLDGRDPAADLVAFVGTRPSPMLAMTTHGRTGLARVTVGSVAMSVVRHAPCPVLVVRSRALAT